jgi:hypothetical protein
MRSRLGCVLCGSLVTGAWGGGERLDAQERTTVGGYGEVQYVNATEPRCSFPSRSRRC